METLHCRVVQVKKNKITIKKGILKGRPIARRNAV
jgi:hypothetical protein